LLPLLEGRSVEWRDDWFYEQNLRVPMGYLPTIEGVRTQDWKYVRYLDARSNREALYDLRADPRERRDVIGMPAHREVAGRLRERWRDLRERAV
jgi:arylsulfatase A-like enzyme